MTDEFAPRRGAHVAAAAVLGIESGLAALAAVLYAAFGVVGDASGAAFSFGLAAITALAAVGLGLLARGLSRARRWAVSPAITWQVLQGFVGGFAITAGTAVLGIGALVLAIAGIVPLVVIARAHASAG